MNDSCGKTFCSQEDKIEEIRLDVKMLLEYRAKLMGAVIATSSLISFLGFLFTIYKGVK